MKDLEERFWNNVEQSEGCWKWNASLSSGYGQLGADGKNILAHRYSFELHNGPIPDSKVVDHICHNRACTNPKHLRAVTHKENMEHQRGARRDNRGSGIRGVYYDKTGNSWYVQVKHNGKKHLGGRYKDISEAEKVAIALRNKLFTNNTVDRVQVGQYKPLAGAFSFPEMRPSATINFFVSGIPAPQGSKRHVGNGRMIESSKKVEPWRREVMRAARSANHLQEQFDEPVRVTVDFYLPAPKKSKFGDKPAGPPDLDKLLRSTFDGLTSSCVIKDDARIVEVSARKHWATDTPGATISIEPLAPADTSQD